MISAAVFTWGLQPAAYIPEGEKESEGCGFRGPKKLEPGRPKIDMKKDHEYESKREGSGAARLRGRERRTWSVVSL